LCAYLIASISCSMHYTFHPPWLDNNNHIRWRVEIIMKLLIVQFSVTSFPISLVQTYSSKNFTLCYCLKMIYVIIFKFQVWERKRKHSVLNISEEKYAVCINLSDYAGLKQSPPVCYVTKDMKLGVPKNNILPSKALDAWYEITYDIKYLWSVGLHQ
jgi:hypothetical protein